MLFLLAHTMPGPPPGAAVAGGVKFDLADEADLVVAAAGGGVTGAAAAVAAAGAAVAGAAVVAAAYQSFTPL